MKKAIVIMLIVGSIVISYFYSHEVYRLHMKTYYTIFKGYEYKSMMKKAHEMYKNNEHNKLHDFLKVIILIYNNSPEAAQLMGMNMIKRGDRKRGVEVIVSSLDGGTFDQRIIRETIVELYRQKLYGDINDVAKKNLHGNDYLVDLYHGISLYHLKMYRKALRVLKKSEASGKGEFTSGLKADLYFYIALSHEELGKLDKALKNLNRADKLSPSGKRTGEAMVRTYRKLGDYHKAEKRLRRMRNPY